MTVTTVDHKLRQLVANSLAPGARIQRSGGSALEGSWWFELIWSGRTFELRIPAEEWIEEQQNLTALRARLAAPAPEATRGGHSLWIRRVDRRVASEAFNFDFQLFRQPQDHPQTAWVRVAVPSAVKFATKARELQREPHAYLLATVLWELKDRIDHKGGFPKETMRHTLEPVIKEREPAASDAILTYVSGKLECAYRIAGLNASLTFDWTDFDYLGITQMDFMRTVLQRDEQDWNMMGPTLSPTQSLADRVDAASDPTLHGKFW
jgi:hypothetical protein